MTRDEIPPYWRQLADIAIQNGAVHAMPFIISDIAFDSRTLLKCMFGCTDWGKGLTCPSRAGSPSMAEYKDMLSRYSWGIIVHAGNTHDSQRASFALESAAFHKGYYLAFSLSDCGLCAECAGHTGGECRNIWKARPAFHSVGIDVFKTVRAINLPIETLPDKDAQPQNWYSAVFVE